VGWVGQGVGGGMVGHEIKGGAQLIDVFSAVLDILSY
jgi:hypothetical protein